MYWMNDTIREKNCWVASVMRYEINYERIELYSGSPEILICVIYRIYIRINEFFNSTFLMLFSFWCWSVTKFIFEWTHCMFIFKRSLYWLGVNCLIYAYAGFLISVCPWDATRKKIRNLFTFIGCCGYIHGSYHSFIYIHWMEELSLRFGDWNFECSLRWMYPIQIHVIPIPIWKRLKIVLPSNSCLKLRLSHLRGCLLDSNCK